jgi:hypothetical protein
MSAAAAGPAAAKTTSGARPNQRPSGSKPFMRMGSPQAV